MTEQTTTQYPAWQKQIRDAQQAQIKADAEAEAKAEQEATEKRQKEQLRLANIMRKKLSEFGIDMPADIVVPEFTTVDGYTFSYEEGDIYRGHFDNEEVPHTFTLQITKPVPDYDEKLDDEWGLWDENYRGLAIELVNSTRKEPLQAHQVADALDKIDVKVTEYQKENDAIIKHHKEYRAKQDESKPDPQPTTPEPEFKATVEEILLLKALREWKGV